jgi:hypothetical protein
VLGASILTVLICSAVCAIAVLAPAPAIAVPIVVAVCIGCPIFAAWELPVALGTLRADYRGGKAVSRLRHALEALPETEHPLGL